MKATNILSPRYCEVWWVVHNGPLVVHHGAILGFCVPLWKKRMCEWSHPHASYGVSCPLMNKVELWWLSFSVGFYLRFWGRYMWFPSPIFVDGIQAYPPIFYYVIMGTPPPRALQSLVWIGNSAQCIPSLACRSFQNWIPTVVATIKLCGMKWKAYSPCRLGLGDPQKIWNGWLGNNA